MSTQYETQGYTINNAGRRLVVDPITRIEGHMRCEVNINDQNVITNAVSCGTMFRGLEIILQGRDPRDAWAFVERICGVCTGVHWLRFTPSKMLSVLKCRTTPISSATLCWQRSGATIIWCTSISLPGWTGSMC
jgi:hypothetical protein